MDLQNVLNITIPEGNVRTIHDEDGNLLWGRLSYDTKYAGDTTQQTYTGKNLLNPVAYASGHGFYYPSIGTTIPNTFSPDVTTTFVNPTITMNSDGGQTLGAVYLSVPLTQGTYHISTTVQAGANNKARISASVLDQDHKIVRNIDYNNISQGTSRTIDYPVTLSTGEIYIAVTLDCPDTTGGVVTSTNPQVELNSSVTTYEPYVGGIPSPNPDFPQAVNVVTGEQTITVSDGGSNTHSYNVDLGTIELAKIGTYQDYIYKSGDDWYVYKEIGKVVLDGSEGWSAVHNSIFYWVSIDGAIMPTTTTIPAIISNYYKADTYDNIYAGNNDYGIGLRSTSSYVCIRNKDCADVTALQTWLSNHNTTVYYALTTPTDTKITDAGLIANLNNINQFLTRYGYNTTVSGNLPLIIAQTTLT